jgi:hypothetical protein
LSSSDDEVDPQEYPCLISPWEPGEPIPGIWGSVAWDIGVLMPKVVTTRDMDRVGYAERDALLGSVKSRKCKQRPSRMPTEEREAYMEKCRKGLPCARTRYPPGCIGPDVLFTHSTLAEYFKKAVSLLSTWDMVVEDPFAKPSLCTWNMSFEESLAPLLLGVYLVSVKGFFAKDAETVLGTRTRWGGMLEEGKRLCKAVLERMDSSVQAYTTTGLWVTSHGSVSEKRKFDIGCVSCVVCTNSMGEIQEFRDFFMGNSEFMGDDGCVLSRLEPLFCDFPFSNPVCHYSRVRDDILREFGRWLVVPAHTPHVATEGFANLWERLNAICMEPHPLWVRMGGTAFEGFPRVAVDSFCVKAVDRKKLDRWVTPDLIRRAYAQDLPSAKLWLQYDPKVSVFRNLCYMDAGQWSTESELPGIFCKISLDPSEPPQPNGLPRAAYCRTISNLPQSSTLELVRNRFGCNVEGDAYELMCTSGYKKRRV